MSSWGSSNYRPSAPFLYEVASHVKKLPFRPLLLSFFAFHCRQCICTNTGITVALYVFIFSFHGSLTIVLHSSAFSKLHMVSFLIISICMASLSSTTTEITLKCSPFFNYSLVCSMFVDPHLPIVCNNIPSTTTLIELLSFSSLPVHRPLKSSQFFNHRMSHIQGNCVVLGSELINNLNKIIFTKPARKSL